HIYFFFSRSADHRDLHSFPTRRSSDLATMSHSQLPMRATPCASASCSSLFVRASFAFARSAVRSRTFSSSASWALRRARRARSRSEEHTSELQSRGHLVCRLLLEKKKI